jgi:NADH:ubiquinone oxidoreductase subunit
MLTTLKKIFTWWNQDTIGTRLKTVLYGKFVGTDSFGNKYYEGKDKKRWVIYSGEIDATKIPVEWYSWIHSMPNRIEKKHNLKKYEWQKPHQSNTTGTEKAYYPNKNNVNAINKKYKSWKSE